MSTHFLHNTPGTTDTDNAYFQLAFDFVQDTQSHIYLTGKAGSGKTTFLRYVKAHCSKKMIVVAPTGVAAINAGGVTMHSFFQLPFGTYVADWQGDSFSQDAITNRQHMLRSLRLSHAKRDILLSLELLIIDEVSMLRSDKLDAIDDILRSVRRDRRPFGGVQVLFIGDLYQLPPVVTHAEEPVMSAHYPGPFFFQANVFNQIAPVYIELKKIYRQSDPAFLNLLNNIRYNQLQAQDIDQLQQLMYNQVDEARPGLVTLCSHNYKADQINKSEIEKLHTPSLSFQAQVQGDFSERQYPADFSLSLKVGAQVMFIKNDSHIDKRYYNGKIGIVSKIEEDTIWVNCEQDEEPIEVLPVDWENISYRYDKETGDIDEEVLGTFSQYPLKLAWAITIHKSQGLTFDHVVIDAGDSFAPGQVYVALSRCTSLQGITLRSAIQRHSLSVDERIASYHRQELSYEQLLQHLQLERRQYQIHKLTHLYEWKKLYDHLHQLMVETENQKQIPDKEASFRLIATMVNIVHELHTIHLKFKPELDTLIQHFIHHQQHEALVSRVQKASHYYIRRLHKELYEPLVFQLASLDAIPRIKKYKQQLQSAIDLTWHKIQLLQTATLNDNLLSDPSLHVSPIRPEPIPPPEAKPKKVKGESARESLAYFLAGKSIEEIAQLRQMATSTIEGHLVTHILLGELAPEALMSTEQRLALQQLILDHPGKHARALMELSPTPFSFAQYRLANHYVNLESGTKSLDSDS